MPIWLNENTIQGEMSDEDFLRKVNEQMNARVEKELKEGRLGDYGNDGLINVYEERCSHNGIYYWLRVPRYFAVARLPDGIFELRDHGMNKIGKHVVVEHDGASPTYELKEMLGLSEFLYHDSLHSGQEDWTLRQQWEEMDNWAKIDCERIDSLAAEFDQKVKELQQQLVAFIKSIKTS